MQVGFSPEATAPLEVLRANKLKVVEELSQVSSRLIVNPASLKLKRATIAPLIEAFRKATHG